MDFSVTFFFFTHCKIAGKERMNITGCRLLTTSLSLLTNLKQRISDCQQSSICKSFIDRKILIDNRSMIITTCTFVLGKPKPIFDSFGPPGISL